MTTYNRCLGPAPFGSEFEKRGFNGPDEVYTPPQEVAVCGREPQPFFSGLPEMNDSQRQVAG